jgi:hypothetical protein
MMLLSTIAAALLASSWGFTRHQVPFHDHRLCRRPSSHELQRLLGDSRTTRTGIVSTTGYAYNAKNMALKMSGDGGKLEKLSLEPIKTITGEVSRRA